MLSVVGFTNMKRSEVWLVEFFPQVGDEISKQRPAVIVNDDAVGRLKLRTIVPITDFKESYRNYPWILAIEPSNSNGLSKHSAIDCFQIKNYSTHRFIKKIGSVSQNTINEIHKRIAKTLDLRYKLDF